MVLRGIVLRLPLLGMPSTDGAVHHVSGIRTNPDDEMAEIQQNLRELEEETAAAAPEEDVV